MSFQVPAIDLLERITKPCTLESVDGILQYLHSGVEDDHQLKNDGYCDALEAACEQLGFKDGLALNIHIEKKLLEYEYKWKNTTNVPSDVATEYLNLLNIGREDRTAPNYLPLSAIVNEIEQVALEKGVVLPHEENTITWALSAIKILSNNETANSTGNHDTALRDLRFANAYLARQYTEHVQYETTRLRDSTNKLQEATQRILELETEKASIERDLDTRIKENYDLTLQNALLKVDNLGASPVTTTSTSAADYQTPPASADSPSVRILRAQFKKQVEDLNDKFASELERLQKHYEKNV